MRKNWIHSLPRRLKLRIGGRDIGIFLMSLLLAFGIWLIHNLSLLYSDTMTVPVIAECNLEGHSEVSANSSSIAARCRTTGFNLLKNRHKAKKDAIHIRFDTKDMHPKEGEMFYITSAELGNYVTEIFGDGVQLESFLSETVQFRFPFENNKKVPVQAVTVVSFKPQFMAIGPINVVPDSVTIYGEPYHINNVDRVFTRTVDLVNLKSSAHGSVKLEPIQGVRMSDSEVSYSLDVSRFVELQKEVQVTTRNVPAGVKLSVYPSTAKVIYKCTFPLSRDPRDLVHFYIDYHDFEKSIGGRCIAHSSTIPEGVIEYSIDPEVFDCVEEGKL